MESCREEWYDANARVAAVFVDVTTPARALARAHLCGPSAAYGLSKGLAAAALLGVDLSAADETLILQVKGSGPLGGLHVECSQDGALRGYTEKKILDDLDAGGSRSDRQILGKTTLQVTRSIPGRILSQGVAPTLNAYLTTSLQRRATLKVDASVSEDGDVLLARGLMVEALPDAPDETAVAIPKNLSLAASPRTILTKLGLRGAELRKTTPLVFKCRCSPERAQATLAALSSEELAQLPARVDVTCHMCGRTFSVPRP